MSAQHARVAVPTIVAVIGVLLVLRASGVALLGEHIVVEVGGGPTPYSADHERVQARPRPAEELAPTF